MKLVEFLVCLEKCVLDYIFGVFAVLRDVLSDAEDLPVILLDQLLKCVDIAFFRKVDERDVRVNLLGPACGRTCRLDTGGGRWLQNFLPFPQA